MNRLVAAVGAVVSVALLIPALALSKERKGVSKAEVLNQDVDVSGIEPVLQQDGKPTAGYRVKYADGTVRVVSRAVALGMFFDVSEDLLGTVCNFEPLPRQVTASLGIFTATWKVSDVCKGED